MGAGCRNSRSKIAPRCLPGMTDLHHVEPPLTATARHDDGSERRDFLILVTGALATVGVASTLWPFISSMQPAADTLAAGAPVDVDLSPVKEGQQITVVWRGHPVWVLHRTADEL